MRVIHDMSRLVRLRKPLELHPRGRGLLVFVLIDSAGHLPQHPPLPAQRQDLAELFRARRGIGSKRRCEFLRGFNTPITVPRSRPSGYRSRTLNLPTDPPIETCSAGAGEHEPSEE